MNPEIAAAVKRLTPLERRAIKLSGVPGWFPWQFEAIANGVLCKGAVCPLITRGPRIGEPNYRRHDPATRSSVVVPVRRARRTP